MQIDLNSDLGEGFGPWPMGDDAAMLDIVSTANIACGFHAGDPQTMRRTISLAHERGVAVGAHPGYCDLIGFGRRAQIGVTVREIEALTAYQVGAFQAMASLTGNLGTHVKTHGALGNACADDDGLADAVARGIRAADPGLAFMVMPGTATERACDRAGLRPIREIYADRTYDDSFNLTSRKVEGAIIHNVEFALTRVMEMVTEKRLESVTGKRLPVEINSVCVHGDNVAAVAMAKALRDGLEKAGWTVSSATAD
ncbi:MAG: LamB/YcsF family protein [Paracoccaceae bacterium]|nr:LamB/YcsF family protein [Paracoccaceae bacterium]